MDFTSDTIKDLGFALSTLLLLAYVAKLVIPYLLKKLDQKDAHIEKLTKDFTEVQNHKTSEMTKALACLATSIEQQPAALIKALQNAKLVSKKTK